MSEQVFLDTSYAIALSSPEDSHHARAVAMADDLETENTRLVTTHAVLVEIGNALSKQRYRSAAAQLLTSLASDPNVEIVPLTEDLYSRALDLFRDRTDKEWGMTDCISFMLMKDRNITHALTADTHFQQAGFVASLRQA